MKITFERKATHKADSYVVFAIEGGKLTAPAQALDKKALGAIKRAIQAEGFAGAKGKLLTISGPAGVTAAHIIVAGLGRLVELKTRDFEKIGSSLTAELNRHKTAAAQVLFGDELKHVPEEFAASHLAEGMLLNSYRFDKYLTKEPKEKKPTLKLVDIIVTAAAQARKEFDTKSRVADAVFLARDLISEVPNILYPE